MSPALIAVIAGVVFLIIGLLAGYILRKSVGEKAIGSAEQKAQNMLLDAQSKSEQIKKEKVLEAKEEIQRKERSGTTNCVADATK